MQGTAFFMSGVVLVVWGWAVVGMLVETYGFWLLFAGFVPTALSFLRRVPVFGRLLDLPMFKRVRSDLTALLLACPPTLFCGLRSGQRLLLPKLTGASCMQVLNVIAPAQTLPI